MSNNAANNTSITYPQRVGFIGLGGMGQGMARRLLTLPGLSLSVWNRSPERATPLAEEGARIAATPADAARSSDVLFVCLTDEKAVEEVIFGAEGVASGASPGLIVVDCSTISPEGARRIGRSLKERSITFIDAPVSGGDVGAKNGTLTFMMGGPEEVCRGLEPLIAPMGKRQFWMGESGAGQLTKCANQIAVSLSVAGMTEAIIFAERCGLSPEKMVEVIRGGAAGSWTLDNYAPRLFRGDLAPGFKATHQRKDLRITLAEAAQHDVQLPVTEKVLRLFEALCEQHGEEVGNHALLLTYKDK